MTYEDYLQNWSENFGDEAEGEYGYWIGPKHYPVTVHKLSEDEFYAHSDALENASLRFETAERNSDDSGMCQALRDRFPHELALVI